MAIELLFARKSPGKIGSLELDATISEHQSFRNEVTAFPIESGSSISDHVIQAPEEITIDGFVTNTPIEFLSGIRTQGQDYVTNAYFTLLEIAGYKFPGKAYFNNKLEDIEETVNQFKLVEILTSLRLYTDMALISLDIPRDAKTGDTLHFTATFRKVVKVEVKEIPRVPETVNSGTPATKTAPKQTPSPKATGKAGVKESILHKGKVKLVGGK